MEVVILLDSDVVVMCGECRQQIVSDNGSSDALGRRHGTLPLQLLHTAERKQNRRNPENMQIVPKLRRIRTQVYLRFIR